VEENVSGCFFLNTVYIVIHITLFTQNDSMTTAGWAKLSDTTLHFCF